MRYLYRSFLLTMMRDTQCKPISEESRRFYEIALQDKRRSGFNRLLLYVDGLLLFVYYSIKSDYIAYFASRNSLFASQFFFLFPWMSIKCQRLRALYELWSDISQGKNDSFIKFANRKAYFKYYMSDDLV